jgi:hypothetical protein
LPSSSTITYTPITGNDYFKGLIAPLSPEVLFGAMQNGLPADSVLFTSFVSINGLRNESAGLGEITPADPGFHRVRQPMREIQVSGAVCDAGLLMIFHFAQLARSRTGFCR